MGKLYLCDMEKEFIPYEQALELKELGFDEPCLASWNFYTRELNYNGQPSIFSSEDVIQLPTFSQAFRWFRKMYDLQCWCEPSGSDRYICRYDGNDENGFRWVGYLRNIHNEILYYSNYEEAELACLIKMIEIKKKYI
jgi:hypothetical protein